VSIAKAGIIATLNARTSILAAANPIESRYNPRLSIVENIQLPPTLLSRFDLIYLMLDPESPDGDALLARHLVSLYETEEARRDQARVPYAPSQLAEYISYARAHVNPVISDDARALIVEGYVEMRKLGLRGGHGKKTITATTRQLESIIRLSEAHARMRLCYSVEPQDVQVRRGRGARRRPRGRKKKNRGGRPRAQGEALRARARTPPLPPAPTPLQEALRLIRVATQTAAIDPRTGQIDMNRLSTGHAANERDVITALVATLRELLTRRGRGETLSAGQLVKDLAMLGGGGGGGGGGDGDGDGDAGYGGGGGGGGGGFANSASADEVAEALRILTAEDRPIIRFAGQNRVTVI